MLRGEKDENGEEILVSIEDDEEFDRIADIFDDEFADIDSDMEPEDETSLICRLRREMPR